MMLTSEVPTVNLKTKEIYINSNIMLIRVGEEIVLFSQLNYLERFLEVPGIFLEGYNLKVA